MPKTKKPVFAEVDCGRDDSPDPADYGTRIYSYDGRDYGVSLGGRNDSTRITVLWRDGKRTHPDTRGIMVVGRQKVIGPKGEITFQGGRWKIC
jgi:hypothetical protein